MSSTPALFLGHRDVADLLPMGECIEAVAGALLALAEERALQPLRQVLWLPDRSGLLVTMPGGIAPAAGGGEEGVLGVKTISVFPDNPAHGEESHQGLVVLFDAVRGKPFALVDAASVTAIRTAAASAVATRALAREDADELAILGTGVQARTHLDAMCCVRRLRRVRVWSRDRDKARRFAEEEGTRWGLKIEAVGSAREAVKGAGLICTVTSARHPVLEGDWLAEGAHVNAVGACTPAARELDSEAVARSCLYVDRRESALNEAGDILIPLSEGAIDEGHIQGEIGEVLAGRVPGRGSAEEVTLFKSLGLAVEDLAAGLLVYRKALTAGRGVRLDL
jgi:ornithine cyclodeaminase